MGWLGDAAGFALGGIPGLIGADYFGNGNKIINGIPGALGIGSGDPSNPYRNAVSGIGGQAGTFGQQNAGNYQQDQAGINSSIAALQAQANGQNSVSAEQLRQGNQQALAAQSAMAAGASPNNSAMAARNAAMNMGRLSYGLSGQQATAGLQERQQAQQALANLQLGQSGQNMQGALGGYNAATGAYGAALGTPQKTWGSTIQGAINAGTGFLSKAIGA